MVAGSSMVEGLLLHDDGDAVDTVYRGFNLLEGVATTPSNDDGWAVGSWVLPAGTGCAACVGIGAVGTAMLGIILLGKSRQPMRLLSIALIVVGIVGLKLAK